MGEFGLRSRRACPKIGEVHGYSIRRRSNHIVTI